MYKIGIYDRYLLTLGGGERYSCKIAEILSKEKDNLVDLLTDLYSDLNEISDRLNIDLSKVNLKIFPLISDDYAAKITSEYDIFINATYLSSLLASAKYNIYICYFPTPFDTDFRFIHKLLLFLFRKVSLRLFRKAEKIINNEKQIEILEGIYEPKRFLLKRGSWTSGKVVLKVDNTKSNVNNIKNNSKENITKANFKVKEDYKISKKEDELKSLKLGLKNPSDTNIEEMNVEIKRYKIDSTNCKRGDVFYKKLILKKDEKINFEIPLIEDAENVIEIVSDYFIPATVNASAKDSRALGVVLYDERKTGVFQKIIMKLLGYIPMFIVSYPADLKFLESYDEIIAISEYSSYWIKKFWGKDSKILFPPVDISSFKSAQKEKIILSVGRFFPEHHNKKQLELAQAFIELVNENPETMKDFRLVLAGGLENKQSHINYVNKIKEISNNYSIEILPNISWDELNEIFAKALIFWHASGLNEDENKNPEKFEHFGITTVEAMASGCIPIVINKGGQKEIIKDGVNGFTFNDVAELKQKTLFVIEHDKDMDKIRLQAIKDSKKYSDEVFEDELLKIISSAKKVLGTKHLLEKENRY